MLDNGIEILFQNEYLIAKHDKTVYAVTPDIICLIEKEKSIALTVENVKFGMQVVLAKIDSPAIWKTEAGLKLVGPQVFGYEFFEYEV